MATVLDPLHSVEAVGSFNVQTFSKHKGQAVVRTRTAPGNPQSARQLLIRGYQTAASRAWAGLSDANRANWADYALAHPVTNRLGQSQLISGFNWYCGLAVILKDLGKTVPATPPAVVGPPVVTALVATPGAGSISFAFTAEGGTATSIDIWLVGPHSAGRSPLLANASHSAYGPAETTPKVVSGLSAGLHTCFVRLLSETDGQQGPWTRTTALVT